MTALRCGFVKRYFFSISIGIIRTSDKSLHRACCTKNATSWSWSACSRLPQPAPNFWDGCALAIHQHANPIDARSQPRQKYNRSKPYGEGKHDLPDGRRFSDDPYQHGNRREERKHRHPKSERGVWTANNRKCEVETHHQKEHHRQSHLTSFLRSSYHRANQRVDRRINVVTQQKEKNEVQKEYRRQVW